MKNKLYWRLIGIVGIFVLALFLIRECHPGFVEFLLKCLVPIGTLSAVIVALFGESLKGLLDPIRINIVMPDESNSVIDKGPRGELYVHHLVVKNLTPHKAIVNCQMWLKRIFVEQVNGQWVEEIKFAVPRRMEWSPSEFSRDKRTFSKQQVFDLGFSFEKNGGFIATYDRDQGGNVPRQFPVGKKVEICFLCYG